MKDEERAKDQARAQLDSIIEMVNELQGIGNADYDDEAREQAEQRIHEDPLSLEIRSGWYVPGATPEPYEFKILLCTGGPAVQIVGNLNEYNEPETATLQYQDWFTEWKNYTDISGDELNALLEYCQCFYFGD